MNTFEKAIKGAKKKEIITGDMDRIIAVLIYKGKLYADDSNHQYLFQDALIEEGQELGYDIEEEFDRVLNETYQRSKNNEIFTYSVFDDGKRQYFIAHFETHLKEGWLHIKDYIEQNQFIFGYQEGETGENKKCIIYVESQV